MSATSRLPPAGCGVTLETFPPPTRPWFLFTVGVQAAAAVAFDETVKYAVRAAGGLKSTLFSGEGLVCELTGPGKILLQTRSEDAFLSWLIPNIPKRG